MAARKMTVKMEAALRSIFTEGRYPSTIASSTRNGLFTRGMVDGQHRITLDGVKALTADDESTDDLPAHLAPLLGRPVSICRNDNGVGSVTIGRVISQHLSAPVTGFRLPMVVVSDWTTGKTVTMALGMVTELSSDTPPRAELARNEEHYRSTYPSLFPVLEEVAELAESFTLVDAEPTAVVAELVTVMEGRGLSADQVTEDLDRLVTSPKGRAAVSFYTGARPLPAFTDATLTPVQQAPKGDQAIIRAALTPPSCCSNWTRGIDCGCADAAADRLTGFEPEDDPIECDASVPDGPGPEDGRECGAPSVADGRCSDHPRPEDLQEPFDLIEWHQHRLYGRRSGMRYLVLGSGLRDGRSTLFLAPEHPNGSTGRVTEMAHAAFTSGYASFAADCGHGYGPGDSCPMCDATEDTAAPAARGGVVRDLIGRQTDAGVARHSGFTGASADKANRIPPYPMVGIVRDNGYAPRVIRSGEPEEESSAALAWTDDYATEISGGYIVYTHSRCGYTYFRVDEYRALGGLVRAMLSHNVLCGR
jgi:hypothetical protein